MGDGIFAVYRKEVFLLAKTMVIKHHGIALAMNRYLSGMGQVVEKEPETWRYYLHLSGEYHSYDKPMYIINLDDVNAGKVLLTKELLANNRITRESYQYGERFYNELVAQYPEQESLILGMLNPVHINTAIESEDGTILAYNKDLVEDYELYFIEDLEKWIKNYLYRWSVKDFIGFNDRYLSVLLADIYSKLPGKILQIRLNYCHTDYVHSYHVRQFLESNLKLGQYVPYMSRSTMMFLYRNIRWILRNVGKTNVFNLLVKKILTEQNIPLTEHHLIRTVNNADDIVEKPNFETDPYPDVKVLPRSINFATPDDTSSFINVRDIVEKQSELLEYTEEQIEEFTEEATKKTKSSSRNELITKTLESVMVDNTNSVYFPLGRVLLSHWIYYACTDNYPSNISFINPSSNEQIVINTLDALILYCYLLYTGLHPEATPPVYLESYEALGVFLLPNPTEADINKVIDRNKVSEARLARIMDNDIYKPTLSNTGVFYEHCVEIQKFMMKQRYAWASTDNMTEHAMLINAAEMFYSSYRLDPMNIANGDILYSDWLNTKGLAFEGMEREDYIKLAGKIAGLATGAGDSASRTIQEMHTAMISLMERLSSYSIQYLRSITSTERMILDWYFLRTDNYRTSEHLEKWIGIPDTAISRYNLKDTTKIFIDVHNGVEETFDFKDIIKFKSLERMSVKSSISDRIKQYVKENSYPIKEEDHTVDLSQLPVTDVQEYLNP